VSKRASARRINSGDLNALLNADDDLTVVVRGHIYLEAALNVVLEHALPKGLSNLDELRFPARVDLAVAIGGLAPEARDAWLEVNRLRNDFAHDLDARIDDERARRLIACMLKRHPGFMPPEPGAAPRNRAVVAWAISSLWSDVINRLWADLAANEELPVDVRRWGANRRATDG
jgi:hypothetical protein